MKSFTSLPKDMHLRHKSGTKGTRNSYMWMCINIFVEKYIHTHEEFWEKDSKTSVTAWEQKGWVRQGSPKGRVEEMWHCHPSVHAVMTDLFSQVVWGRCGWLRENCTHWAPPELVWLAREGIRTESILLLPSAAYSALQKFQKSHLLGRQWLHYSIFLLGWKWAIGKNWYLPLRNWWTTWTLPVFKWRHKSWCQISQH